jgi:TatD-related deoxyribonuclease
MFADAHSHVNPIYGVGPEKIARRFRDSGGWFIALVCLPPWSYGLEPSGLEAYDKSFRLIIDAGAKYKQLGLEVAIHLGHHPSEVDYLNKHGLKLSKIRDLGFKVVDLIAKYVMEGYAHGLGEFGRQHYPTKPENREVAEDIARYAIQKAKDLDVSIHLHLDQSPNALNFASEIAKEVGMSLSKVVIHHLNPELAKNAESLGLSYTVVGKIENLKIIVNSSSKCLVESDYLDDPKRPGAVIPPWTISKTWRKLLADGLCDVSYVQAVNVDNVIALYKSQLW